jgi:hypothetical protein
MSVFETLKEKARDLILGEAPQPLNLNLSFQPAIEQTKQAPTQANVGFRDIKNYEDLGVTGRLVFERADNTDHQIGLKDGKTNFTGFQATLPKGEYTLKITDGESTSNGQPQFRTVFEKAISITDDSVAVGGNFSDFGLEPFLNVDGKSRKIAFIGMLSLDDGAPTRGAVNFRCD